VAGGFGLKAKGLFSPLAGPPASPLSAPLDETACIGRSDRDAAERARFGRRISLQLGLGSALFLSRCYGGFSFRLSFSFNCMQTIRPMHLWLKSRHVVTLNLVQGPFFDRTWGFWGTMDAETSSG
jgi:hypothetical protein